MQCHTALPILETLHERHPGLTSTISNYFSEAASVCLSRHHSSPTDLSILLESSPKVRSVVWNPPDNQTQLAWNNEIDTTEDGAYGICIATVEVELGLVVVARADTGTGADWYLSPVESVSSGDLEEAYRLEVSGLDRGTRRDFDRRLRQKVIQTKRGVSNLPAIASVVAFLNRLVGIDRVTEN